MFVDNGRFSSASRTGTPAGRNNSAPGGAHTGTGEGNSTDSQEEDERFASNPLTSQPTFVKSADPRQRTWLLLAPTSTWSFSRRVLSTIRDHVSPENPKPIPVAAEDEAYGLSWRRASSEEVPDVSGLPPIDYAIYMLNTVKFHLGQLFRLFDEVEFLKNLYEFYDDAAVKVQTSRLWFVQYLLILAFGEAFLTPIRTVGNTAGWSKFFTRAMSLMPDPTALWPQPMLAIEVLALAALYLHSVDMRESAYCFVRITYIHDTLYFYNMDDLSY